MTTAIANRNPADLTLSSQERGLRLLAERVSVRMVDDPMRGRYLERAEWPALTPSEAADVRQAIVALQRAMQPGQRAAHIGMLARLAAHRGKERSPQEWQMVFEDYAQDLAAFSNEHVAEAIREHRRSSNFFPTIAEIMIRCRELVERDKWRLQRARQILSDA